MGLVRWMKWRSESAESCRASSQARRSSCDEGEAQRYSAWAATETPATSATISARIGPGARLAKLRRGNCGWRLLMRFLPSRDWTQRCSKGLEAAAEYR